MVEHNGSPADYSGVVLGRGAVSRYGKSEFASDSPNSALYRINYLYPINEPEITFGIFERKLYYHEL
jgi:hypothetical protein